jgi:hypothetical protein
MCHALLSKIGALTAEKSQKCVFGQRDRAEFKGAQNVPHKLVSINDVWLPGRKNRLRRTDLHVRISTRCAKVALPLREETHLVEPGHFYPLSGNPHSNTGFELWCRLEAARKLFASIPLVVWCA